MSKTPGRPREFHADHALDAAMRVFWKYGYEGASLRLLTAAMGIDRKSMYLAFGDKAALFGKILRRYSELQLGFLPEAMENLPLPQFVDALFETALAFYSDKRHPATCMSLHGFAMGEDNQDVLSVLKEWRRWVQKQYQLRFDRAQREGEIAGNACPADLARYLAIIMAGLAVQAANGATPTELKRCAQMFRERMPFPSRPWHYSPRGE